jgi:hypothetical protein
MTTGFKDYITGIYIMAPKPTTFKVVLHNGQFYYLTYLGKAYEAEIAGRKYYLMAIGEKERAIIAIANLLKLGRPASTEGPDQETAAGEEQAPEVETPPSEAEEEKTES